MSLNCRQPFGVRVYDHCEKPQQLGVVVTRLLVRLVLVLVQVLVLPPMRFDKVGRRDKCPTGELVGQHTVVVHKSAY
jgi:hypothetical protein